MQVKHFEFTQKPIEDNMIDKVFRQSSARENNQKRIQNIPLGKDY